MVHQNDRGNNLFLLALKAGEIGLRGSPHELD
jgi:hypothetical protein